jgi:uncharacterized protein (TIGR00369 family)
MLGHVAFMINEQQAPAKNRTRTYDWGDPSEVIHAVVAGMSGLELLQSIGEGRLPEPPALRTLGIEPVSAEPGKVIFSLQPAEFHYNPMGLVHGGVLVALMDTAMGCALHAHLGPGMSYVTTELSSQFARPVTEPTGRITCTGLSEAPQGRSVTTHATVVDAGGQVLATASSTCLVRSLRPPPGR